MSTSILGGTLTFVDGTPRAGQAIVFVPRFREFVSGGNIVVPNRVDVTLDGNGAFSGLTLEGGPYDLLVDDKTLPILLQDGGGSYDLSDVVRSSGPITAFSGRQNLLAQDLSGVIGTTPSISATLGGARRFIRGRAAFFGGAGTSTIYQKLASAANSGLDCLPPSALSGHVFGLGNMNGPAGAAATLDSNLGPAFSTRILGYTGAYAASAVSTNRFWYGLGATDWLSADTAAVASYITAQPSRYFTVKVDDYLEVFVVSSAQAELGGVTAEGVQMTWLQAQLSASTRPHRLVVFADAPQASISGYADTWMNLPWLSWGATALVCGSPAILEHITMSDGLPLFIAGGAATTMATIGVPLSGSNYRYATTAGGLVVAYSDAQMDFLFINDSGQVLYQYQHTPAPAAQLALEVRTEDTLVQTSTGIAVKTADVGNGLVTGDALRDYCPGPIRYRASVANLPLLTEINADPTLEYALIICGYDPPKMYYWNRSTAAWELWNQPYTVSNTNETLTVLADPTLTASAIDGTVELGHADNTVQLWLAVADGSFTNIDWTTESKVLVGLPTNTSRLVRAYAWKTGSLRSGIVTITLQPIH